MAHWMLHRFSQAFHGLLLTIRGFLAMACWHWTAVKVFLRLPLRVVLVSFSLIWFCFFRGFFVRQHQLSTDNNSNISCCQNRHKPYFAASRYLGETFCENSQMKGHWTLLYPEIWAKSKAVTLHTKCRCTNRSFITRDADHSGLSACSSPLWKDLFY